MKSKLTVVTTGRWHENCYLLSHPSGECLVIDPGEGSEEILAAMDGGQLQPIAIVNTHAHYDHVGSVSFLKEKYQIPFALHQGDHRLLGQAGFYRKIFGGERSFATPVVDLDLGKATSPLAFSDFSVRWHHTPGHTSGSVCIECDGFLFTGDTLFTDQVGRTDLPGGDKNLLKSSLVQITTLNPNLVICPGHGPTEILATVIQNNHQLHEALK